MKRVIFILSLIVMVCFTANLASANDYGWKDPKEEMLLEPNNFIYAGIGMGSSVALYYLQYNLLGVPHKVAQISSLVAVGAGTYFFEDRFSRYNEKQGGASFARIGYSMLGSGTGIVLFTFPKSGNKVSLFPTTKGAMLSMSF